MSTGINSMSSEITLQVSNYVKDICISILSDDNFSQDIYSICFCSSRAKAVDNKVRHVDIENSSNVAINREVIDLSNDVENEDPHCEDPHCNGSNLEEDMTIRYNL